MEKLGKRESEQSRLLLDVHNAHSQNQIRCRILSEISSRVLRDSTPRYVGPSVGWSHFYFFGVFELFELTAPAQMRK